MGDLGDACETAMPSTSVPMQDCTPAEIKDSWAEAKNGWNSWAEADGWNSSGSWEQDGWNYSCSWVETVDDDGAPKEEQQTKSTQVIFNLSLPKNGTTSLHEAFRSAGLQSVHWVTDDASRLLRRENLNISHIRTQGAMATEVLVGHILQQNMEQKEPLLSGKLEHVKCLAQMDYFYWDASSNLKAFFPQCDPAFLRLALDSYPDAKFVLITRDPEAWLKSVDKHHDMRERFVRADLSPHLPPGVGGTDEELMNFYRAHAKFVRATIPQERLCEFGLLDEKTAIEEKLRSLMDVSHIEWGHFNKR